MWFKYQLVWCTKADFSIYHSIEAGKRYPSLMFNTLLGRLPMIIGYFYMILIMRIYLIPYSVYPKMSFPYVLNRTTERTRDTIGTVLLPFVGLKHLMLQNGSDNDFKKHSFRTDTK